MQRILIIRLSAIGDVAMASGLIPALRRAYPNAYLAWLVEPAGQDLLRHNRALNELIVWPKQDWQRLWQARRYRELSKQVSAFRTRLRALAFDHALDLQGILKSAVLARLSGAPTRIGLDSREGSGRLMTRVLRAPKDHPQLGSEYRHLGAALGLGNDYHMDVALGDDDRATAVRMLTERGVNGSYAALCPFTTRPQKHWFEGRWAELAGRLAAAGMTPLLLGGPESAASESAARITATAGAAHGGTINLVGATRLGEAAALIAGSALVVGVDTGLTHLGAAFRRPSLALFGSTRPYLDTGSAGAEVLYQALSCSPCRRRPSCDGRFDCMRTHQANEVANRALRLVQTGNGV